MTPARRLLPAATAALLLAAVGVGAIVAARPAPPRVAHYVPLPSPTAKQIIHGWLAEQRPHDGGRLIRVARTSGPYRLEYRLISSGGNEPKIRQRVSAAGGGCAFEEVIDPGLIYHVSEIRAILAAALARCAASPRAVRTALGGLEPAYERVLAWDWAAAMATTAGTEVSPMYGPDDALTNAACDAAEGAPERDITEMNASEAAQAVAC